MEMVLFWLGSVLTYIGAVLLYNGFRSQTFKVIRNGQVVGFARKPYGQSPQTSQARDELRTVFRFLAIDDHEYFLMESVGSRSPRYQMGEFVPLVLSQKKYNRVSIKTPSNYRLALVWLLSGLSALVLTFWIFPSAVTTKLLMGVMVLAGNFIISEFLKTRGIDWRRIVNGGQNTASFSAPIVIPIEESKNIAWVEVETAQVRAPMKSSPQKPWIWHKLFFYASLLLFAASGYWLYQTEIFYRSSTSVNGSVAFLKSRRILSVTSLYKPVVRFYGTQKNIVEFEDPIEMPISFFKTGQIVKVRFNPQNLKSARVDLGSWKHFWSYFLFSLGVVCLFLSKILATRAFEIRNKKVIPINIRKVS